MSRISQITITAALHINSKAYNTLEYIWMACIIRGQCICVCVCVFGYTILIGATNFFMKHFNESSSLTRVRSHNRFDIRECATFVFDCRTSCHYNVCIENKTIQFNSKRQTQLVCMREPIVRQSECRKWIFRWNEDELAWILPLWILKSATTSG